MGDTTRLTTYQISGFTLNKHLFQQFRDQTDIKIRDASNAFSCLSFSSTLKGSYTETGLELAQKDAEVVGLFHDCLCSSTTKLRLSDVIMISIAIVKRLYAQIGV